MEHSLITAESLSVMIGGTPALRALDLAVFPGETVGVFGTRGSGKSVLLRILAGLLAPSEGALSVLDGTPSSPSVRAALSYVPAHPSLPAEMTATELLVFYGNAFSDFDGAKARGLLTALKLKMNKRFGELSLPTKKKVQLIFGLSRRARIFLLDEPLRGDGAAKAYALERMLDVRSPDTALLFTAQDPSDTETYLDRFLFLARGEAVLKGRAKDYADAHTSSLSEEFRRLTV